MSRLIAVSDDRLSITIGVPQPGGMQLVTEFTRPAGEPWTEKDIHDALAQVEQQVPRIAAGEKRWTRAFRWRGWIAFVHLNTGPPTWWLPKIGARDGLMIGWLRVMVAVHIRRQKHPS